MRPNSPGKIDATLLLAHTDWVRDLARSLISPQHADDVAQEAILIALERPPHAIQDERGLRAWLTRVVRNLGHAAVRGDAHRRAREREVARRENQPSVAETVARASQLRTVVDEVMGLDEPYRDAVLLRYFEQLGAKEIAEITGATPAAVRMRVSRGLDTLRARLDADGDGEGRRWLSGLACLGIADVPGSPAVGTSALVPGLVLALGAALLAALPLMLLLGRSSSLGDRIEDDIVAAGTGSAPRTDLSDPWPGSRLVSPENSDGGPVTEDPMRHVLSLAFPPAAKQALARAMLPVAALSAGAVPAQAQWSTETLSLPRAEMQSARAGTKVLFGYGNLPNFNHVARVDIYDLTTGTWDTPANRGPARHGGAGASVGNLAIFAGGWTGPGTAGPTDAVDVYDASTGTWSNATLSRPYGALASATVGSRAFFGGGDVVEIYDDSTGAWSTMPLPTPRHWMAVTSVGTKVFFAGGRTEGPQQPSTVVDIYDDATGMWSTGSLSEARFWFDATRVGSLVMFAGGLTSSGPSDVIDIYDDATGAWSVHHLSSQRFMPSAVTVGQLALVAGGTEAGSITSNVVEIYDSVSGQWTADYLSMPRAFMTAVTAGEKAFFAGGVDVTSTNIVDIYDLDFGDRYCSPAIVNSSGSPAAIRAMGRTKVSMNDLSLFAVGLPLNQFGFFLNSETQANTFPVPNSQGALCVGGAIGRYNASIFNSGNTGMGSLQLDLANTPTPSGTVAVQPGETWNFTAWYRDVNPNSTSNFTDGVSIGFQ